MDQEDETKIVQESSWDSPTFNEDVSIHLGRDVGSATISPSGRDVALASLDGLDIIDLDRPYTRPRHLRHTTSWSVTDVQWSPFAARDYWVVSTSYQRALVWNLAMSEKYQSPIEHTLYAHSRAITDINFSAHHPDILSTCAVDGYVHCWDLRRPRTPCMTFVDWFAGATQVKWNRQDEHILASSHDRWLRIWDERKGSSPLRSIEAHESKIYGVDWNRTRATGIVTCSLDRSIKFWDVESPDKEPERVIRTDFPVWRARHTPFGWGLLAMPQDIPGDLHLYDRRLEYGNSSSDSPASAVKIFPGHGQNKVKEFLWRVRGGFGSDGIDSREFQLVSWGEDGELRLQHVGPVILNSVGYNKGMPAHERLSKTRSGATYRSFCDVEWVTEKKIAAIPEQRATAGLKLHSSALSTNLRTMSPPKPFQGHMMPVVKDKHTKLTSGNQIGWISGIKFNKKAEKPDPRTGIGRRFSLLPPGDNVPDWDSPESLHEEIIRVHAQFSKVTFDDVNLDKRNVLVSMNGPWGSDGSMVFIKVNIDFPDHYPETEIPTFSLVKTSNISVELSDKIINELHELAEGFAARKKGCLEAALCYLLGEIDLEESRIDWSPDTHSIDENSDGLAEESSSDEDGDIPPGASAMMSQELDASGASEIHRNGNANVPLPRLCGATFSMDGKLVCFFPPKEDKVKSLLSNLGVSMRTSRGERKTFETFGRLKNESPGPRNNVSSIADQSRYDSDSSESSYSSSSDSDSSPFPNFPGQYWRSRTRSRRYLGALSTNQSVRSSAAGTGTGTATGTAFSKSRPLKPKNIISIYDLKNFSSANKALAKEYSIFGDGPDVCEKNAEVAARHGCQELSDMWKYARLILLDDIPLDILTEDHVKEPILIVANDAIRRSRRSSHDSGVHVSDSASKKPTSLSGRVKWGHNPLARHLIETLFNHFEHPVDIQMLAMLSCVFSEPAAQQDSVSQIEMDLSKPIIPMPMKTPAFSLDYFPSDSAAWNSTQPGYTPKVMSLKRSHTSLEIFGSHDGSNGVWGSDPHSGTYSTGDTPPGRSTPRGSTDLGHSNIHSLSTSPENSRGCRRANSSGLASSLAASFSRPFTTNPSPPNKKRPSPVETVLNSFATANVTWGGKTILGSLRGYTHSEVPLESDDEEVLEEPTTECNSISLTMEVQEIFDDEGCMTAPLLNVKHAARFANYRKAYAELLFVWGEHLSRLEILKFSGLPDYFTITENGEEARPFAKNPYQASVTSNDNASTIEAIAPSSPIQLGKIHSTEKNKNGSAPDDMGVDITGYCLQHDCRLVPVPNRPKGKPNRPKSESIQPESNDGAVGYCERCKLTKRQLRCVICTEPIMALYAPCLSCGCASHQTCLVAMHAVGEMTCAGGCDCECAEKAEVGVVESWEVMIGMINRGDGISAKDVAGASGHVSKGDERSSDGDKDAANDKDWDGDNKAEWDDIPSYVGNTRSFAGAFGRGIGTSGYRSPFKGSGSGPTTAALLSTRLERVRAADWGGSLRRKATSLRSAPSFENR